MYKLTETAFIILEFMWDESLQHYMFSDMYVFGDEKDMNVKLEALHKTNDAYNLTSMYTYETMTKRIM